MSTLLRGVGRLFNAGTAVAERVEVLLQEGRVAAVGAEGSLRPPADVQEYDCGRGLVTAGLVDAHTHPLYARPRLEEVARRSAGESYAQLAKLGGGISATVRQTREAAWPELEAGLRLRLRAWLAQGTTTVEAKTGYWLTREGELAAVRLLASLAEDRQLPHLAVTLLGAHALPEDFRDRRADFVAEVATWSAPAASLGARFADVFCDQGAFSVDEARAILAAAGRAGLGLRLHADELALTGGAQLGADLGACSADHLLQVGPAEIGALAQAGTVATLCPITAISLGKLPPARELSAAGVQLALGTDHNPGTSGTTSMPLVVWLAIHELGLSVEQALAAATTGGAASLGDGGGGRLIPGAVADAVLWDADHEGAFAWQPGLRPLQVWRAGEAMSPG